MDSMPAAENQVFLRLGVPREVWSAHVFHSQFVDLVLPGMAPWQGTIANRPGYEFFEFLVKDVGERSRRLCELAPGDEILISRPMGAGFPVLAYRRFDIILAASGVAVCAMRPVIAEIILYRNDWARVMLFYGERTSDRFAFGEEREYWRENKIEVYLSASRPSEGTSWKGHVGYIQDLLTRMAPDIRNTVAFVAGKDAMIEGVRVALERLGMLPSSVFLNV